MEQIKIFVNLYHTNEECRQKFTNEINLWLQQNKNIKITRRKELVSITAQFYTCTIIIYYREKTGA